MFEEDLNQECKKGLLISYITLPKSHLHFLLPFLLLYQYKHNKCLIVPLIFKYIFSLNLLYLYYNVGGGREEEGNIYLSWCLYYHFLGGFKGENATDGSTTMICVA